MSARPSLLSSAVNAAVYSTICVVVYQIYHYQRVVKRSPLCWSASPSNKKKKNKAVSKKTKLIVVTGCDRGFGRMLAEALTNTKDGNYLVLALTRTETSAQELSSASSTATDQNNRRRLYAQKCDVTNDHDVAQAASYAQELLESQQAILYAICNNAGIANPGNCLFFDNVKVYQKVMDVNYLGQVRVIQAFVPLMMRTSPIYGGRILNMSSVCGTVSSPGNSSYNASKFAVEGWSDSLRIELEPFGIQVTKIRPGAIATDIQSDWQRNYLSNLAAAPEITREYYGGSAFETYVKDQFEANFGNESPPSLVVESLLDLITLKPDVELEPYYWVGNDAQTFWRALASVPTKVSDAVKRALALLPQLSSYHQLPPSNCVSHVTIHVRDLKESLPFYMAFGLEPLSEGVDGQQFLSSGTSKHPWNTLVLLSEDKTMPTRDKCYDAGETRLCLISLNIQKDMERLAQAGIEPMAPMIDAKAEKLCAYADRDGFVVYMIELKGLVSFFANFSLWWNKKRGPIVFHWTLNVTNVKSAMSMFDQLGFRTMFDIPKEKVLYDLLPAFNIAQKGSEIEDIRLCNLPKDTLYATLMQWTQPKTSSKGTEHLNAMTVSVDDVQEALALAKTAGMHIEDPPVYKRLPLFGHVLVGTAYLEAPKTCKIEFCSFTNKCTPNQQVTATPERPKILLFGDSLTQTSFEGWGAVLADRYQRRADVLNRGLSGYNTRWALRYAQDYGVWEEPGKVALVTLFFGANDAALVDRDPSKYVPVAEYKANLLKLIDLTRQSYPAAKILLLAPPPVHEGQRLAFQKRRYGDKATGVPERTSENTENYAVACMEAANEKNVPCLDLFHEMLKDGGGEEGIGKYLSDGLHFGPRGHHYVLDQVLAAIKTHFPNLAVHPDSKTGQPNNIASSCQDLPSSGPYHDEINYKEWEKAFNEA